MSAQPDGSIFWIEIPARDIDKLKNFYAELFPVWEFESNVIKNKDDGPKVYFWSFKRPDGLAGGIVEMPKDCPPHSQNIGSGSTVYYLVDNVDEATARVEKLGGKIVLPKQHNGNNGVFAQATDPEGNRFALFQLV